MPLPEADALSPWQGHPTGMSPLPVAVGSCLPGGCRMWEGALRGSCPREKDPHSCCVSPR